MTYSLSTVPSQIPQTALPYFSHPPLDRSEKAAEILGQIAPASILTGLQALGTGAASSATTATTTATSAAGAATGSAARALAPFGGAVGIAGALYGAFDLISNWGRSTPTHAASSGMALGAAIGTFLGGPGIGTALGAGIGTLAGGIIGAITSGKHRDQKVRDQMRDLLVQNQVLDSNYQLTLADGTSYDMGVDGGPRAELGGRRPYEVDLSNPLAKYAISWLNPLIALITRGDKKLQSDCVGYFANAALSNAKSLEDLGRNVAAIMKRFGVDDQKLAQAITAGANGGAIPTDVAQAYLNGIRERRGLST